ncbi:MAG: hypothetical protein Q8P84_05825 [Deltaproteobacteria bacterium]|nr:hypothetical protein [Deltaproteobacteria bacterium]
MKTKNGKQRTETRKTENREQSAKKKFPFSVSLLSVLCLLSSVFSPTWAKSIGTGTIKVELQNNALIFDNFVVTFQRTLRIPDDGKEYPLPPGLGRFPIYKVSDFKHKVPQEWAKEGGVFIPMYQREAMWISFGGEEWRPRAVKTGVGGINALNGEPWNLSLQQTPSQNYLVAPRPQEWIDGIKEGKNTIRQFVAMPLGGGFTVSEQVGGKDKTTKGGLKISVFNPKKGKFKKPPPKTSLFGSSPSLYMTPRLLDKQAVSSPEMGIAAGGKMTQKIYSDPYGITTWNEEKFGVIMVHIVNSEQFEAITGEKAPESPITKKDYEQFRHPWFGLYDEEYKDIKSQEKLKKVKSVRQIEKEKGVKTPPDEESIPVKKIIKYKKQKSSETSAPPGRQPEASQ